LGETATIEADTPSQRADVRLALILAIINANCTLDFDMLLLLVVVMMAVDWILDSDDGDVTACY